MAKQTRLSAGACPLKLRKLNGEFAIYQGELLLVRVHDTATAHSLFDQFVDLYQLHANANIGRRKNASGTISRYGQGCAGRYS